MGLLDITPAKYKCAPASTGCPAIFKSARGTYIIIGKFIPVEDYAKLVGRIGPGEVAIEVPAELLEKTLRPNEETQ